MGGEVNFQSDFEVTKGFPYLDIMGELWEIICVFFRKNDYEMNCESAM